MSETRTEVKEPWTDEEFCIALARAWLKLYKAQTGGDHPWGPITMWESEPGLAYVGKSYREKVEASDALNIKEDYKMLAFNARSALKQKYGIEV